MANNSEPDFHWEVPQGSRSTLGARNFVFERIIAGTPLPEVLDILTRTCEELMPERCCSVLLFDAGAAQLQLGAAPSLPESAQRALDGTPIGPSSIGCGAAAYTKARVLVEDLASYTDSAAMRELAEQAGLRACWSQPIFSSTHELLGTFAMYSREPGLPDAFELDFIGTSAEIAGMAIERTRKDEELQRYRVHLEELVAQRTAELERTNAELACTNEQLRQALQDVKVLRGMLPICAWCKRVRDDQGYWAQIEQYLSRHTDAVFTHALCPDCAQNMLSERSVPVDR